MLLRNSSLDARFVDKCLEVKIQIRVGNKLHNIAWEAYENWEGRECLTALQYLEVKLPGGGRKSDGDRVASGEEKNQKDLCYKNKDKNILEVEL